ncbi:LysE family translocator [Snodgrassella sp. CFCC 13594]|uniref:LysE family translocator n=1 Tax=Snodgrassella sp. CFCC 13594 TaxID=1775559 RepID=UPI00082E0E19|nr:LysE family translocator [Snodgrassella sp. CFCC 13594]
MGWGTWWLFVLSNVVISATPGPNMLLAFQYGLNYGLRKTVYTLLGLSVGLLILLGLSIGGVSIVSSRWPAWFEIGKSLGALYLAYLGWQAWHARSHDLSGADIIKVAPTPSRLFRIGLGVSLSNPKAILFFAAFFPQFVQTTSSTLPQYLILIVSFFVIEITWQLIYAYSGKTLAQWLHQGKRLQYLNRGCAVIFILIAVGLLLEAGWYFMHE